MTEDFFRLLDPKRCPGCGFLGRYARNGMCLSCGVRLFPHTHNDFRAFEMAEGIRHWWAFDREHGWRHRDFFMVPDAKPLLRNPKINPLPKNYGRKTTPGEVAGRGGKISKRKRERLRA